MAKNEEATAESKGSRVYTIAGIALAIVTALNIFLVCFVYLKANNNAQNTQDSMFYIYNIDDELLSINRNALMIVSGTGDAEKLSAEITMRFKNIEKDSSSYLKTSGHSANELKRYNQAKLFIDAYHAKLLAFKDNFLSMQASSMSNIYIQELHPLQTTSTEMLQAAIEIGSNNAADKLAKVNLIFYAVLSTMGVLFILGEIGIIVTAKITKKASEALIRKTKQAEAAASKFKKSQQKVNDIAYTNILTNMKNRYALDAEIGERLGTDSFNIAAFDVDNFRSINDIYGYDFGDEYLAQIAEKLTSEYSQYAEIYNITGNEFCFVFNNDISESQAVRISQNIFASITALYNIANISIQLAASGCTYHYLANDCLNLSTLLIKMDAVIRNVKRNGGNRIMTVDNI